ncbi:arsenical resistance protein ArsH [Comamonas aquatica]|jgi:arsenic resistance protein ArsH|nr:arsenical resistance protein ArsH [Comamonas aquatica]
MSCVTIYHNPNCGTSRNTLAMIRQSGVEPNIVEYLQNPPSRAELKALLQGMGKTVREVLRQKGTPYEALDLDNPQWTDEQLLDFVEQHPILLNRPIVVTPLGVRLCRPSEAVLDILPNAQIGPFTKEDGELVEARQAASAAQLGTDFPALATESFQTIDPNQLKTPLRSSHAPRILMLYGSLRERSYSKLLTLEAARLLEAMGAEVRIFNPEGLPQPDAAPTEHPKVKELRDLVRWCEGMVWTSPERHGAMTGIMKSQIDWIPLSEGAIRPTQGKTLAVMQVCGGSQSFNAVNQLRVLGRWMRLLTIPNQSSVAKAYEEFEENGRMKPSSFYDRVVDVMEELMKFTLLTRDIAPYLVDRYSERKEDMEEKHAQTLTRL